MNWPAVVVAAAFALPAASQEAPAPTVQRYLCEDGRVVDAAFLHLGPRDLAILSIDGTAPVMLGLAPSASGARYTGTGVQWWGKGMENANLAPLGEGEDIAADAGTACRAEN